MIKSKINNSPVKGIFYILVTTVSIILISSCDQNIPVEKVDLPSPDWEVQHYQPVDWESGLVIEPGAKNASSADETDPTAKEMLELQQYISIPEKTKALKDVHERIGVPNWNYSEIHRNPEETNMYTIMAPLMRDAKVNGTLEFFNSTQGQAFRITSWSHIQKALNGGLDWNDHLRNVAYGINNFRMAQGIGLEGYVNLNNWVIDEGVKLGELDKNIVKPDK